MQSYTMSATRLDGHGTRMNCNAAELHADSRAAGRADVLNQVRSTRPSFRLPPSRPG